MIATTAASGAAIAGRRDEVQLATKFGFTFAEGQRIDGVDGAPANAKRALEGSRLAKRAPPFIQPRREKPLVYVPAHFRIDDGATLRAFMRAHAFATLVTVVDGAPFATHLPLLVDGAGDELVLRGHVARANPQWRTLEEQDALAIFSGPHAYVSPSWYGAAENVPTWNYATVHALGRGRLLTEREGVMDVLRRLTDGEETRFAQPWSMDRLTDDYVDGMRRAIVAFEIPVTRLEGKYKLSQNRTALDQAGVADALTTSGDPAARDVAALMHAHLAASSR